MALYSNFRPEVEDFRGISLCAGYGGLDLGLHIAEPRYRTVCYVEREAHAAAALVARMADEALAQAPVWDDLKSFDGGAWRGKVHLLSAGYPCQPFSVAGNRKGRTDPRHLWPEVARIARELAPEWIFCENVEGHVDMGLPQVGTGLQKMGYRCKAGLFSAAETGASHRRRRIFILAHADRIRCGISAERADCRSVPASAPAGIPPSQQLRPIFAEPRDANMDDGLDGLAVVRMPEIRGAEGIFSPNPDELDGWQKLLAGEPDLQPAVLRTDNGLAERMDQLRGVGNGVSSMAAAVAWAVLKTDFDRDMGIV